MGRTLVVITGASSGIGEAFARRLAPEHDLLLVARRKDRLEKLATELSSEHPTHIEISTADLTLDDDVDGVAQRLATDPRLALLVNNAGFGSRGLFWKAPLQQQEDMHKLHIMAPLRLMHAALSNMVPRDFGAIINVASIASFIRTPGNASYSATKTWLSTFTEAIYTELKSARSQVVVQALCPGYTYSEFHDALGVDREKLGSKAMWHSAEFVVDASLDGLRRHKLFVVPGWRYRLLLAFLNSLPSPLRVALEANLTRTLPETLPSAKAHSQIDAGGSR
ncbi:MAG TPA: SDR family oxidoreductase [Bryobacteraceae bacterium]|nr:SDR family oxidoreductase [Bryobacteraceae bacterium]